MANIITKTLGSIPKNAALTNAELDNNFINLNEELITKINKNTVEYPSFTQSLHKSPNVIASMFIYDTSKDSDGGAWTDKCQNTSWYNEPLSGNWLGIQLGEVEARCYNSTVGSDIVVNGSFTTDTNWTKAAGVTINNGTAIFTNVVNNTGVAASVHPITSGIWYQCVLTVSSFTSGGIMIQFGNTNHVMTGVNSPGIYTRHLWAPANSNLAINALGTSTFTIDSITVKPVLTLTTSPNDYFQLIGDGKFYSLSKNYLTTTATLATQTQFLTAGTYTISSTTASTGSVAITGAATATHTAGTPTTFTVTTSGAVTFTVTGSVLTAQVELGTSATTYSANTSTTRYSETFRGNKKEFPKISAIVGEPNTIIIYDLTEKNNPMWMRFPLSAANPLYGQTLSSIDALNSNIAVGSSNTTNGALSIVSFISDSIKMYTTTVNKIDQNISQRNNTVSFTVINSTGLVSRVVSSVSMAILPNAPIDAGTGLKIPTVAVATTAGVNLIKDNGVIIKSASNAAYTSVVLYPNILYISIAYTVPLYYVYTKNLANSFNIPTYTYTLKQPLITRKTYSGGISVINAPGDNSYSDDPMLRTLLSNPMNKRISKEIGYNYNAGYGVGSPLRAYLCSSNSGNINTSTELVTNGTFDTDTSGWVVPAPSTGTITFTSINGVGVITANNSNIQPSAYTIITTVPGKHYKISGLLVSGGTNNRCGIDVYDELTNRWLEYSGYPFTGQLFELDFTAVGYTAKILLRMMVNIFTGTQGFDNISVKEYEINRLKIKKYADIYGTLTKSPVNTGTDLVAYSGFSNTNYIQEPYSGDISFATGEFNISSWVIIPINNTNAGTICSRSYPTGPKITLSNNSSNNLVANLYDGTTTKTVTTTNSYNTGNPVKVSASYKFGKLGISVNGQEVATDLGLPLKALSGAWEEKAPQLNAQTAIYCLLVYNGKLYGGTSSGGRLFEWNGTNAWIEVANKLNVETNIMCLTVFNNKIYGGTYPNAKLFEWNGTNAWIEVATGLNSQTHILCLVEYNGKLYGATQPNGKLFEWNGTNAWVEVANTLNAQSQIYSLAVYNGKLYGGTNTGGKLFEWNGTNAWVEVANTLNAQTTIYSLAVYNGKLYGGIGSGGRLFEWNGTNAWVEVAPQLDYQTHIYSLAVYNGKLYGGTYPSGRLFEWNGTNAWVSVAPYLNTQGYIWSLAVYNGGSGDKLYGGTATNGKLFEWNGYGSDAPLTIGNSTDLTTPFPGSLSLLKISGSVPTKEQELFMYEQEKLLFNENTKCLIPENSIIVDISGDEYSNTLAVTTNNNLSKWNGLVRTNNIPVPFGYYTKIDSAANITIAARSTSNIGVDILSPKYNIKKKIAEKDSYSKSKTYPIEIVDYIAGFTGTTTLNSNVITSNDIPSYDIIDTIITGTNIPANTTIIAISGTSIYISNLATGAGSYNISFLEYKLPIGYTTKYMVKNGVYLTEGATKDYTRVSDEFREIIKLVATPNYQDWIQLQITKKQ